MTGELAQAVVTLAAVVAALGVLWRALRLGQLLTGTRLFLDDWNGEAARPGVERRASFPERMAAVEERTRALTHDVRGELSSRLILLGDGLQRVEAAQATAAAALVDVNSRVTEHRRRNDELVHVLQLRLDELRHQQLLDVVDRDRPTSARTRSTDRPAPAVEVVQIADPLSGES